VTAGLHRQLRDDVIAMWTAGWTVTTVPAFWRSDDLQPLPDPSSAPHFFRNEVDFGREAIIAFGNGRGDNLKAQFGSVMLRIFSSRMMGNEDDALDYISAALAIYRSQRNPPDPLGNDLSFIGEGSGFDQGPTEDGNWFMRGALMVFEYRFRG
jgi:hypothetical protein